MGYRLTAFSAPNEGLTHERFVDVYAGEVCDFESVRRILVHNWVIAQELKPSTYNIAINAETIRNLRSQTQDYMVIDIKCEPQNILKIADKFAKYKHILMQSKNGLRGILFFKSIKQFQQRPTFNKIQSEIGVLGELNPWCIALTGKFAPLGSNVLISENKDDSYYEPVSDFEVEPLKKYKLESTDFNDACLEYFTKDGFTRMLNIPESKGYIIYLKDNEYFKWNPKCPWIMFNDNPAKTKNIYKLVRGLRFDARLQSLEYAPDKEVHCQTLTQLEYKDACDNFIKNGGALAIKSYMGSNKSEALGYVIGESKKLKKKVIVITSRVTLAQEFKQKFKLPLYSDFKGKSVKYKGSLICQYDSLARIDPRGYDIAIVDEFASVVFHSVDNLVENKREVLKKFLILLKKDIVIADAFLNTEFLRLLRRPVKTLTNAKKDTIEIIECTKIDLFEKMSDCLSKGEQVSISTNSVKAIESTIAKICRNIDKTSTVVIGPKTNDFKFEKIESLNRKKYKEDIIIYSPALSLGVSIFNKIKNHFHFDSGLSANAIQSIQMLRRARKSNTIYYYIGEFANFGPQDFESYKQFVKDKLDFTNSWMFEISDIENELSEIGIYCVQVGVIMNILKSNTKTVFNKLLGYNFENIKYLTASHL